MIYKYIFGRQLSQISTKEKTVQSLLSVYCIHIPVKYKIKPLVFDNYCESIYNIRENYFDHND